MEQLYLKKCNCGNFELEHYFNTKTNEIIYINKNSDKLETLCKAIDVIIFSITILTIIVLEPYVAINIWLIVKYLKTVKCH